MQVPILDLKAQYASIKEEIREAIDNVCDSQMLCLGPAVTQFEENIAAYCRCTSAIGVSSGSDALLVSLMAMDLQPGDEVITTPFTFFATAGAISRLGGIPVFVDIQEKSFNIDPTKIEAKITEKTKGIIPVHLFGQVAQMEPIQAIAKKHGLWIVEDACQAIGASQNGTKCGNFGELGCFSFYPTKNLGGFGDGGLVTINSKQLAEKVKMLRTHGENPRYYYRCIGGNFRLDGIQGAVLDVKLKYLDQWSEKRRANAALYNKLLADTPVATPFIDDNNVSIYHQYTIRAKQRDNLQKYLAQKQVSSAVFYPHPLHLQDCFASLGYKQGDLHVAEQTCKEVLSLPIYPELSTEQIEYVAGCIKEFYQR